MGLKFADWVPKEVMGSHLGTHADFKSLEAARKRLTAGGHSIATHLIYMDRLLTSDNPNVKLTWLILGKRIAKIRDCDLAKQYFTAASPGTRYVVDGKLTDSIPATEWERLYSNTYGFLIAALHSATEVFPVNYAMLADGGNTIVRDLMLSASNESPSWLTGYNQTNRGAAFKEAAKDLKRLRGFISRNDTDFNIATSGTASDLDFRFSNHISCLYSLVKDGNYPTDKLEQINKHLSSLSATLNELSQIKTTDHLRYLGAVFDFIGKYSIRPIEYLPSGTDNVARNIFIYALVQNFHQYLGTPLYGHVGVIAGAIFHPAGQPINNRQISRIHQRIKTDLEV